MEKRDNIPYIDSLRTIAILAVILIHTSSRVLEIAHYDLKTYYTTLYLNQFARFAVPLFIIISGFVLELNYQDKYDIRIFIKKRFSKTFIPYVFWSLIYLLFVYTANTDNFIRVLLVGNASYQLYFIPTICILYLMFPILHKIYKLFANLPIFIILIFFQIQLMNQDYFIKQFSLPDPIRTLVLGFIFFIIGMIAARKNDLIIKLANKLRYVLLPLTFLISYKLYENSMAKYYFTFNINAFYSQWRAEVLWYTIIIALTLIAFLVKNNYFSLLLNRLSKYSYFVFFIHIIFIEILWRNGAVIIFSLMPKTPVAIITFDFIYFLLVSLLSFGAALIIRRIPKIKFFTG
jgi:surface polysaccharide O-acyltransferase-like enzyme